MTLRNDNSFSAFVLIEERANVFGAVRRGAFGRSLSSGLESLLFDQFELLPFPGEFTIEFFATDPVGEEILHQRFDPDLYGG